MPQRRTSLHGSLSEKTLRHAFVLCASQKFVTGFTHGNALEECSHCEQYVGGTWSHNSTLFQQRRWKGQVNFYSAARRSINWWACCTCIGFPCCSIDFSTHVRYTSLLSNKFFKHNLLHAITLVPFEEQQFKHIFVILILNLDGLECVSL